MNLREMIGYATPEQQQERFVWHLFEFLGQAARYSLLASEQQGLAMLMGLLWGVPREHDDRAIGPAAPLTLR